jgi:hypothetical protein
MKVKDGCICETGGKARGRDNSNTDHEDMEQELDIAWIIIRKTDNLITGW